MKKLICCAVAMAVVLVLALPFSATAAAEQAPVGLNELIEHAADYDKTEISFKGEAIGDILYRDTNAWVNLSDGNNSAIGVYMTAESASKITALGGYGQIGDILIVRGTFNRACAEHGGDMDIHAKSIEYISRGAAYQPESPTGLVLLAVVSATCALCIATFAFLRIRCYNKNKKALKDDEGNENR